MVFVGDCKTIDNDYFKKEFIRLIVLRLNIREKSLSISGLSCGSIIVKFTIETTAKDETKFTSDTIKKIKAKPFRLKSKLKSGKFQTFTSKNIISVKDREVKRLAIGLGIGLPVALLISIAIVIIVVKSRTKKDTPEPVVELSRM